jgi:hypothetical protein
VAVFLPQRTQRAQSLKHREKRMKNVPFGVVEFVLFSFFMPEKKWFLFTVVVDLY